MVKSGSPRPDRERHDTDEHDVLVIRDAETLRIVSDPLRLRMLELMRERPQTAKGLATALRVSRTKLYYHLNLLTDRGLIAVADTRLVSGIVEKQYRVTAYRMTVDKALIGPTSVGNAALDTYVSVVLDEVRT
jgi:DNA-binding transcriptional ArsR family regulator